MKKYVRIIEKSKDNAWFVDPSSNLVDSVLLHALKLNKYEEICPRCGGWSIFSKEVIGVECRLCKDRGKIDWVDKLMRGNK